VIPFTAYDKTTGEVLYSGTADVPSALESPIVGIVEEICPANSYRDSSSWVSMPSQPSKNHEWNWQSKSWVDTRTLDDLKENKWESLRAKRNAAESGGFTWDGSTFDSDPVSQGKIQGAALAALIALSRGRPFSVDWTLANNSIRTLSAEEMIDVGEAMLLHITSTHEHGRTLRERIFRQETTAEELSEITWEG
jgi:hypothetical protein